MRIARKHLGWYAKDRARRTRAFRAVVNRAETAEAQLRLTRDYFDALIAGVRRRRRSGLAPQFRAGTLRTARSSGPPDRAATPRIRRVERHGRHRLRRAATIAAFPSHRMPPTTLPARLLRTEQARLVQAGAASPSPRSSTTSTSPARAALLEVGSGVGAQTEILLRRFPDLHVTCVDLNERAARGGARDTSARMPWLEGRYALQQADATDLPFEPRSFDGAFLCWVLEHVPSPARVLNEVRRVLVAGLDRLRHRGDELLVPARSVLAEHVALLDGVQRLPDTTAAAIRSSAPSSATCCWPAATATCSTEVKTFHFDNREPARRKAMIAFWEELLLSAADQLLEAGAGHPGRWSTACAARCSQVQNDPNAVFFYSFVQARATVF